MAAGTETKGPYDAGSLLPSKERIGAIFHGSFPPLSKTKNPLKAGVEVVIPLDQIKSNLSILFIFCPPWFAKTLSPPRFIILLLYTSKLVSTYSESKFIF